MRRCGDRGIARSIGTKAANKDGTVFLPETPPSRLNIPPGAARRAVERNGKSRDGGEEGEGDGGEGAEKASRERLETRNL